MSVSFAPQAVSATPVAFHPQMDARVSGIDLRQPLRYRATEGLVADLWDVEARRGAAGHYLSAHPRIVVFLDPPPRLLLKATGDQAALPADPDLLSDPEMIYVPPGLPVQALTADSGRFRHLDVHFAEGFATGTGLGRSVRAARGGAAAALARRITDEVCRPGAGAAALDALARSLITALAGQGDEAGQLAPWQLSAVARRVAADPAAPFSVAEMAEEAGLSESWFAHAFARTTGLSPHRWLRRQRVVAAQDMLRRAQAQGQSPTLAGIALATGFSDQAHFTRAFRSETGRTPSDWRRRLGNL